MALLHGKAVVVTGSGQGLGAAYARDLARRGASVVTNDIVPGAAEKVAQEIVAAGGAAVAHTCDFSDWDQAGALVAACIDAFGRIDGLVNNGGIYRMARLDEESDSKTLEAVLKANVVGTYNCAAHALRSMQAQGSGSIVNVSSGSSMGIAATGAYGASKGAVSSLTYAWALEVAGSGVRVNAVSPMAFTAQSDISTRYHAGHGKEMRRAKEIAPEANSPLVAYLLSDRSAALNGQILRMEDRNLSVLSHPAVILPVLTRDAWTPETIADAIDSDLVAHLAPVGITGIEIAAYGPASPFWQSMRLA